MDANSGRSGKIKAKIFPSYEKCMTGAELQRLMDAAGMTHQQLADAMISWGWYREKVTRISAMERFCLPAAEMATLLNALGVSSL